MTPTNIATYLVIAAYLFGVFVGVLISWKPKPAAPKVKFSTNFVGPDGVVDTLETDDPCEMQAFIQGKFTEAERRITGLVNQRDGLEADLKARDESIAALGEQVRNLIAAVKERGEIISEKNRRIASLHADLAEHKVVIEGWREVAEDLKAELKASKETGDEMSAELARTLKEREEFRAEVEKLDGLLSQAEGEVAQRDRQIVNLQSQAVRLCSELETSEAKVAKLGQMNESIEKRLTAEVKVRDRAIEDYRGRMKVLEADAEKRVREAYSKGHALGVADAFEKVRAVFPPEGPRLSI